MSDLADSGIVSGGRASEASLPAAGERHLLFPDWNQTDPVYPRDKCIHELFEQEARLRPDAVALELGQEQMTYDELHRRSDHVAGHLRGFGVKPGDLVGLSLERSFERIVSLLGILKACATYWALEENLPEERLQFLIEDARPKVILTSRKAAGKLTGMATIAEIEDLWISPPEREIHAIRPSRPEDPAYVSYTSGSTGQPKGVVVPHRGVVRLVKGTDYVSLTSDETLMHQSPLSFDASTFEIWGTLLNGGRLVILPPGQHSLSEIGESIQQRGVTTLWLSAGLFHLMVDEQLEHLKPLRQLLAGGDVLCPQRVAKARHALPNCRIINGYGPTENTTFTCCYTVEDESGLIPTVPIGRPIANTHVYILDAHLQPVATGEIGELYAGGDGVACGYLNRPKLTAQRFIPDPFSPEAGARLYRTGDSVRRRPDGNIEFLGRFDTQVKIRGFRVELGEIECALRACPGVRDAVVIWREQLPANGTLVGYVVFAGGARLSTAEMRGYLRQHLPEYMTPSVFIMLDQFPLTPNGKLDRRALPAPGNDIDETAPDPSKAKDLLELELIRIWQRLFRRQVIHRNDHFFELGGHSLLAAQLAAEIEKLVGVKLPIATLFQSPTIESLAMRLTEEEWLPPWSSLVPLQPQGTKPPLFLVHGWGGDVYVFTRLAELMAPDQPVYGIQAIGLDGREARHISVESMAAHYIQEIRSLQPEGPYFLGGFSLGGLIAYEIARQLHGLGQRVAMLAFFDSYPIGSISWSVYVRTMAPYLYGRFLHHLRRYWEMPNHERFTYFRKRWVTLLSWFSYNRSKPAVVTTPPPVANGPPGIPGFKDYYHALTSAYQLRQYPGPADVFISEDAEPREVSSWGYLVRSGVTFHQVPGTHDEILMPDFGSELAKALRTALDRARQI